MENMPGTDRKGHAGFKASVNNHYLPMFGSAVMISVFAGLAEEYGKDETSVTISQPRVVLGDTELVGIETIDLDKAIGIALDFAEKEGNTLVVVVGGPEASGMVLVGGDIPQHEVTAKWAMQGMIHTGTMVPVFSYGTGEEKFQGIMKNTDLFFHIKELLLNENKVYGQRDSL